jgi:hypothetical protein
VFSMGQVAHYTPHALAIPTCRASACEVQAADSFGQENLRRALLARPDEDIWAYVDRETT